MAELPRIRLAGVDMTLKDGGMLDLVFPPVAPGMPRLDPFAAMRQGLELSGKPAANLLALLNALSTFIATPGQGLALKLKPGEPMSLADITAGWAFGGQAAAGDLLERMRLDLAITR